MRATYSSGPPTSNLVISKTRVAPLKSRTIPQLELCEAHLLAKLLTSTSQTLDIPLENIYAYTDSTIVLAWLDGSPQRYKIYVANRIVNTINLIPPNAWRHVPTLQNPADCASRGITAQELIHHQLWWHGPLWLQQEPLNFPTQPAASKIKQLQETEAKPQPQQCNLTSTPPADELLETKSNSLLSLIKITCWIKRFTAKSQQKTVPKDLTLSRAEGAAAEEFLLKRSQARTFTAELQQLKARPPKNLSTKSRLLALHPYMDKKNLLRVGGRLNNSSLPEEQKHPLILSSTDIFSKLLLQHYHHQLSHCGPSVLMAHSGNLYHIIGVRRLARSVCSSCIVCRKAAAKAGPQLMGQLPPSRLDPDLAFFHTGIDFAGPYITREGPVRKPTYLKSYLAVFVCFCTKAVHLEVVKDLTTDSFVASLIKFVSRRSLPLNIHTDNGSNLVGAKNELYDLYKFLQDKKNQNLIQSYLFSQKVTWHTIPERAPHFGGLWEAAVKAAKHHLERVVGSQRLTYDELETVVCQAEACMNSRPLGSITSHSPDGLTPLTPGHFLTGRAMRAYPVPKVDFKPTPLQRWVHCQRMGQQFWKRWSQEYLQQLQKAVKWHKKQKNYQVGDIVMLTDGNVYQCQWTMAKVVAVYPGKDGVVRAVDVQVELAIKPTECNSKAEYHTKLTTRTAIYRRPVHKLAMLLAADEVPEKAETSPEDQEEDP